MLKNLNPQNIAASSKKFVEDHKNDILFVAACATITALALRSSWQELELTASKNLVDDLVDFMEAQGLTQEFKDAYVNS